MTPTRQTESREGFTLVEVLVAMTLLSVAMMSLASAAALGLSQLGKARQDLQYAADVQQVTDSLVGKGWNNLSNGSSSIRGRPVSWSVLTLSPSSQRVNVLVTRKGQANATLTYTDTVTIFLAKARVQ
jgi:prepilin-type N-terminal cleavage/methylation domain-containing protein